MVETNDHEKQSELRERAEAVLAQESIDLSRLSSADVEGLFEELRVHQIELELQNEELRANQVQLQRLSEQYRDLYDSAPVGYVTLDGEGRIQRANLTVATMLAVSEKALLRERLSRFVTPQSQSTFHFFQTGLLQNPELQRCQVRLTRPDGSEFVARLEGQVKQETRLGMEDAPAGGAYRVAISDITQEWQAQQALLRAHDQLAQANQALRDEMQAREGAEAELAEVRRRLAEERETQRTLLAKELHEGPVQELYGISFQLSTMAEALEGPKSSKSLAIVQALLKETIRTLREISHEMRPPALAPFGLAAALRSHLEDFQIAHPEIEVQAELMSDDQALEEPVRLALFRIYQATLDNVVQHAAADRLGVRFRLDPERVLLEVRDDGAGFALPERWVDWAQEGRLGLVGAMERAKTIGGCLEVESVPGQGSTVRVVVPRDESEFQAGARGSEGQEP